MSDTGTISQLVCDVRCETADEKLLHECLTYLERDGFIAARRNPNTGEVEGAESRRFLLAEKIRQRLQP